MADEIVSNIAAKLRIIYETADFKQFEKDILESIQSIRNLAVAYEVAAKGQKKLEMGKLAAESKLLTIESKRLTVESKKLALADKEKASTSRDLTIKSKELTNQLKEVRLAQQKARGQRYEESLKRQKKASDALAASLNNIRDSLIAIGVVRGAQGLFNIARQTEQAVLRINNQIDKIAFQRLQKQFEILNKQSGQIFSKKAFEESAAAVFFIDKNTRRFARSLEFAIKQAPVLGKSLQEVQEAVARGVIFGDEEALTQLGLITPLALEEMKRRTGLSLSDLRVRERENFIFSRMRLTEKQIARADGAAKGLNAAWDRFNSLISDASKDLSTNFKPAMIFLLNSATKFFRMLAASPVGLFVLRMGGLIAGVAALTLGIGILSKALIFLRGVTIKLNSATLILMGKYLLWSAVIIGLILLLDDLWLAAFGPKDADTILGSLAKKFNKFFKDIGFDEMVADVDNWLAEIVGNTIDTIDDIAERVKNFFRVELGAELNRFFENLGFTDLSRRIDEFLDRTVDRFFNAFGKIKDLLKSVGIGPGAETSPFSYLPAGGLGIGGPLPTRAERPDDLIALLRGGLRQPGLNLASPGRQLLNQTSAASNVDNSTSISVGGGNYTFPAGLNRGEMINVAVESFRREFEKQLIEADIGGR